MSAAVELADNRGIDTVTMRQLAQALGVEAMSLYNHVAGKDDVLDGMVDLVFAEIDLPTRKPLDRRHDRRSRSVSDALLRHRWALGLLESRSGPRPGHAASPRSGARRLRQAGFSVALAAHAFSVMDGYIYGFVLQEDGLPFADGDDLGELIDSIMPPDMAETYPHFAELASEFVLLPGYSYSDEFEFGLRLILDTLEARRSTAQ